VKIVKKNASADRDIKPNKRRFRQLNNIFALAGFIPDKIGLPAVCG